jgi:hypothetical protein
VRKFFVDVRAAAREVTQEAISTLAAIMKDQKAPAAARISAAVALLDRGHGRPFQSVDVKIDYYLEQLSTEDLMTLHQILERLEKGQPADRRSNLSAPDPRGRELAVWSGTRVD